MNGVDFLEEEEERRKNTVRKTKNKKKESREPKTMGKKRGGYPALAMWFRFAVAAVFCSFTELQKKKASQKIKMKLLKNDP